MLTRIHVQGFKTLVDVEVGLSPLTVLLGPNASGKSNFLESLLVLSRAATEKTLDAAFEALRGYPAEAFTLPDEGLEAVFEEPPVPVLLEADVDPPQGDPLRYRLAIGFEPRHGSFHVADEYLTRLRRAGGGPQQSFKPRVERVGDYLMIRQLGRAGHPRQEEIGLNHALLSDPQLTGETRYPDFDRLRGELASWQLYYLDPREAMRAPQPPREVTDIGSRGDWIAPFLFRLKEDQRLHRHFVAAGRALRSAIPTIEGLDVELNAKRGELDIVIYQEGTPYSSRVISEGTLRILALCCIAASPWPRSLIAFEEPENGVHPRRIEVIADLLVSMTAQQDRQVVVTTHSPALIGAITRRARESDQGERIGLFRCFQEGRETRIERFDAAGPLFEDEEIRDSLTGPDDSELMTAMAIRGWLDG